MEGVTLDASALIALEARSDRVLRLLRAAKVRGLPVTVPVAAVARWWRGPDDLRDAILRALIVEPMRADLARSAGEALAAIPGANLVDAVVMASAAQRSDVVLTTDVDALERLAAVFPKVHVLAV